MARKLKRICSNPFFQRTRVWNGQLTWQRRIRAEAGLDELYVPQENGEINDKKNNDAIIIRTLPSMMQMLPSSDHLTS